VNIDRYLASTKLFDCRGRVSHTLTVQLDGRVAVATGGQTIVVDPRTRTVTPPHAHLGAGEYGDAHVLDLACALAERFLR
jgi:hypothetical protein